MLCTLIPAPGFNKLHELEPFEMVSWRQQMIPEFNQKGANQKHSKVSVASPLYAELLRKFVYQLELGDPL